MRNAKIIFVVVALGAAVGIYLLWGDVEDAIPDTPDTATEWMCRDCKHIFSLTAKGYDEARDAAGQDAPLLCEKCSKKEAYRVATCPTCSTKYFSADVPGERGVCPQCNPLDLVTPAGPEQQEQAPEAVEETVDEEGKRVIIKAF